MALGALSGCDLSLRSEGDCDLTEIIAAGSHATSLEGLEVTAQLRTKDGHRPVPGRTLEFSFEERKGSGAFPVEAETGADGTAVVDLETAAQEHLYARRALSRAHVMHVKYRNPDELSSSGASGSGHRFCASDAWVPFAPVGPAA